MKFITAMLIGIFGALVAPAAAQAETEAKPVAVTAPVVLPEQVDFPVVAPARSALQRELLKAAAVAVFTPQSPDSETVRIRAAQQGILVRIQDAMASGMGSPEQVKDLSIAYLALSQAETVQTGNKVLRAIDPQLDQVGPLAQHLLRKFAPVLLEAVKEDLPTGWLRDDDLAALQVVPDLFRALYASVQLDPIAVESLDDMGRRRVAHQRELEERLTAAKRFCKVRSEGGTYNVGSFEYDQMYVVYPKDAAHVSALREMFLAVDGVDTVTAYGDGAGVTKEGYNKEYDREMQPVACPPDAFLVLANWPATRVINENLVDRD